MDSVKIMAHRMAVKEQCAKLKKDDIELIPELVDIFVLYVVPVLNATTPGGSLWQMVKDSQREYWAEVQNLGATNTVSAVLSAMGMRNFK